MNGCDTVTQLISFVCDALDNGEDLRYVSDINALGSKGRIAVLGGDKLFFITIEEEDLING